MIRILIIPLLLWLGQPVKVATDLGKETCTYEVRYLYGNLNTKVAKAIFTLTPSVFEDQKAYKAEISIKVQPIFQLFLHSKYTVQDYFTRPGMKPLYYTTSSNKGSAWNTGVLVHANTGTFRFYKIDEASVNPLTRDNIFKGTAETISVTEALEAAQSLDGVVLTLGKGSDSYIGFYRYTGSTLAANKAFLIYEANAGVNYISLSGSDDQGTGILHIQENEKEEKWYTIQGVRVNNHSAKHGIYINNGKKIIVK